MATIVVMRRMLGLSLLIAIAGCTAQEPVKQQALTLPAGTTIPLVLAKDLRAGDAKEGEYVPFIVATDVKVGDKVAVPKGTLAQGKVVWSRSEGTLSGLMNQPARLEVKLETLKLASGEVAIACDPKKPDEPYAFTRENTGKPSADETKLDELLKTEMNLRLAEKLNQVFEGKSPDFSTQESQEALTAIANEMGLNDTRRLLSEGKSNVGQITSTIERLQRGDLSGIATGDLSLSLGAVMELANLVGGLGDRVSRALKGRTIHAYPGTKIEAYLVTSATV